MKILSAYQLVIHFGSGDARIRNDFPSPDPAKKVSDPTGSTPTLSTNLACARTVELEEEHNIVVLVKGGEGEGGDVGGEDLQHH